MAAYARGCAAAQVDNLREEYGPAKATDAPRYKKGDRVRTKGYEGTHWDGEGIIVRVGGVCNIVEIDGNRGGFFDHELAPAPLQLEAGKYYRTRDGRKVGPMDVWWTAYEIGHPWESGDTGDIYRPDGTSEYNADLIAEWVGEPQEDEPVAAATQPKFKVGDVVKFRDDYPGCARGQKATVIGINIWGDDGIQVEMDDGDISTEEQSDLEAWMAEQDASRDNTPTDTTGFTVPLCAYDDEPGWYVTELGRAYADGYAAGLRAAA